MTRPLLFALPRLLLPTALAIAACTSDATSTLDAGPTPAPDSGLPPDPPDPPDAGPPPFACEAIDLQDSALAAETADGQLAIFVADGMNPVAIPIRNATVVLETAEGRFEALSDRRGCASFEHASIIPPFAVHIFAPGYRYESAFGDPRLVQRYLLDRNPLPSFAGYLGHVEGTISNLSLAAETLDPEQARYAKLLPSTRTAGTRAPAQRRRDDIAFDWNEILEGGPFAHAGYLLDVVPQETVDVYAIAGTIRATTPGFYGFIETFYFGYTPNVALAGTATVSADVELSLLINQPLEFVTTGMPPISDVGVMRVTYGIETEHQTFLAIGHADLHLREDGGAVPPLDPPLENAKYTGSIVIGSDSPFHYIRSLATPTTGNRLTFEHWVSDLPEPTIESTLESHTISAGVDPNASWCELKTWRSAAGYDWHVINYQPPLGTFRLPQLPAGFEDPGSSRTAIEIRCAREENWTSPPRGIRFIADAAIRRTLSLTRP